MKKLTTHELREEILKINYSDIREMFAEDLESLADILNENIYEHDKKIDIDAFTITTSKLLARYNWTSEELFKSSKSDYYVIMKALHDTIFK